MKTCKTAIFASKLYKSSTNQYKIRAALDNLVNSELVKQLDEYIGEEYKSNKHLQDSDDFDDNENSDSKPESFVSDDKSDDDTVNKIDDSDISSDQNSDDSEPDSDEEATASVQIKKTGIMSNTNISTDYNMLLGIAGELKGTLNARSYTMGVVRTLVKDDDLWIYYNDNINLNNVMTSVIDLLNAANYYYLIFNRLARTENAIVFAINMHDTINNMVAKNEQ